MSGFRIEGDSGIVAEVNASKQILIVPEVDAATKPQNVGAVRVFSENDSGSVTGEIKLASAEVDIDYRQRVSQDLILDEEVFNYTAQNTGKHSYTAATMVAAWSAGQFTTNSTSITTAASGVQLTTYAFFPNIGTQTLSADFEMAFSQQPVANAFIEFGIGLAGTNTTAPTDGAFFRLYSTGLVGVSSSNGSETVAVFPLNNGTGTWAYTNNKRHQFIVYLGGVEAAFWVNDGTGAVKLGTIQLPASLGRMNMAGGLQVFIKQRHTGGAAGGVIQALVGAYNVRLGGSNLSSTISTQGNRIYGAYQGMSGGTTGSLATYPNSTNPTAAAPSNTALTANLPAGLGGQGLVIAAVAATTDGIWSEYGVPAGTVNYAGKRLVLMGLKLDLVNLGAAVATTATTIQFSLAYGHTAVSLATGEASATKAPRRLALGFATWPVGAAIGAVSSNGVITLDLGDAPIFINPSERLALVGKFLVGTATASQTIGFTYTPIYGWG